MQLNSHDLYCSATGALAGITAPFDLVRQAAVGIAVGVGVWLVTNLLKWFYRKLTLKL